jgi:hypothetical protein
VTLLWLPVAVALAGTDPFASSGSGQLSGRSILKVKGCGKDRIPLVLTANLQSDGRWTAEDQQGARFSGTYAPRGSNGRTFDLQFDDATLAAFVATVASDVSELCEVEAVVSAVTRKRFLLRLNRRRTKATLSFKYRFTGSADGRKGSASFVVTVHGPWVAA